MTDSPSEPSRSAVLSPDEAFTLLGNETRIGILHALWDAFESGTGDNAVPFSALFDQVEIEDSGNFTYHLEKLTGPFVRRTDTGYALKQTGINVVRAVVTGTVTADPTFGPTPIDAPCPRCGGTVEVAYSDELMTAHCTACPGMREWDGRPGFLFGGLVPPGGVAERPVEQAFHNAVVYINYQLAALFDGACPHCSTPPEVRVDVCSDHHPGAESLCPNCGWDHLAEVWMVCPTCKRSAFPPARVLMLYDPRAIAFYTALDEPYRFASWETIVRQFDVTEDLVGTDPLELRFTLPGDDTDLTLTVDDGLAVTEAAW